LIQARRVRGFGTRGEHAQRKFRKMLTLLASAKKGARGAASARLVARLAARGGLGEAGCLEGRALRATEASAVAGDGLLVAEARSFARAFSTTATPASAGGDERGERGAALKASLASAAPPPRSFASSASASAVAAAASTERAPPSDVEEGEGEEDECTCYNVGCSTNIKWHCSGVTRERREALLNQRGCVLWMTGLSGSGKSTVAFTLEHLLHQRGKLCYVLDGDNLRHGLNNDLGFKQADREENIRRIGEVAKLMAESGLITVVSIISPYQKDRDKARGMMDGRPFAEVYMKVPLAVCEDRDPKGLYRKVREGKIKGFTGIDAPYEEPSHPEITLDVHHAATGEEKSPQETAEELLNYLEANGFLESERGELR